MERRIELDELNVGDRIMVQGFVMDEVVGLNIIGA
jgi:hypothetical protein